MPTSSPTGMGAAEARRAKVSFRHRVLSGLMTVATLVPAAVGAAAEPAPLRLGSDVWPPFTDVPGHTRVAVELVETALQRAGLESATTIVPWREVEAGLREGSLDGSAAIWHTDARARELLFSKPYLENRLVLVGRKGSDVSAVRLADLAGKRVAAVGRYAYGDAVDGATGVLFVNGRDDQDDLGKLLAGDTEYMLVDELVARYLMANQPDEVAAKLEIGSTPLARRALHFAVRRDLPEAEAIVAAFDAEMSKMITDGTYSRILGMTWIRYDVDGDGLDELVALGDTVGPPPAGGVYDVFGEEPDTPPERQRVFIQGSMFEGWDAVPESYKTPAGPMDPRPAIGTTIFTLQF